MSKFQDILRIPSSRWLASTVFVSLFLPTLGLGSDVANFGYDQVGRVTSAAYANGLCVVYTYDANGNRTAQNYSMSSATTSTQWGSGVWGCYLKWTPQ